MGNCSGLCLSQQTPSNNPIEIATFEKKEGMSNLGSKREESKSQQHNEGVTNDRKNQEVKDVENNDQKAEELDIDMNFMKQNEGKIVKMQANIKGRLVRKQMEEQKKKDQA